MTPAWEARLAGRQEPQIEELRALLRIPSVSTVPAHQEDVARAAGWIADRLRRAGVGRVEALPHDTCADEDLFFSFRRATKRGESRFGVQLSAIGLAPPAG